MNNKNKSSQTGWAEIMLSDITEPIKRQWKPGDAEQKYIGLEHINQEELTINSYGSSKNLSSNKFYFKKDNILFGKLRPYFRKVWKAKFDGVCSTDIWVFEPKEGFDGNFLFYFLANPIFVNKSMGANIGTHMPRADWNFLKRTIWKVPELDEQIAISSVLKSFDNKIDLLRDQNKTLEELAQTLFNEWFVKFNFPNFNGKMVGTELKKIPEEWSVGKLGDEFHITIGRTPPRLENEWFSSTPTGKKWISIKDIGNSEVYISNTSEYLTNEAIKKFNIPIIPANTTILSFKMTVGRLAITTEDMLSNEAIAHLKLKDKSKFSTEFIYLFLKNLDFNSMGSTSSIATAINSTMIKDLEILIPDEEILKKFNKLILPFFAKLKNNNSQIQTLSTLRDTLLPKLIKGEIRVKI